MIIEDNKFILTELFSAWRRFKKGKSNKTDVQNFENFLETNIFELWEDIVSGDYTHGGYEKFQVFDSKKRIINKASIRDRIIHEYIRRDLELIFEKKFIRDSYASRKEKGGLRAVGKLRKYLKQSKYTLSLDIKKYFNSIDHKILLTKLEEVYSEDTLQYFLCREIVHSFNMKEGKGIPLGNSISQVFSNIYFHEVDIFGVKVFEKYIRYNDDVRICLDYFNVQRFNRLIDVVKILSLEIPHSKIRIDKNSKGVLFLGSKVFTSYFRVSNKSKRKIYSRVNMKNKDSYLGLLSNGNNYKTRLRIKAKVI